MVPRKVFGLKSYTAGDFFVPFRVFRIKISLEIIAVLEMVPLKG